MTPHYSAATSERTRLICDPINVETRESLDPEMFRFRISDCCGSNQLRGADSKPRRSLGQLDMSRRGRSMLLAASPLSPDYHPTKVWAKESEASHDHQPGAARSPCNAQQRASPTLRAGSVGFRFGDFPTERRSPMLPKCFALVTSSKETEPYCPLLTRAIRPLL